jgi:hypothetical protein
MVLLYHILIDDSSGGVREYHIKLYQDFIKLVPGFSDTISELQHNPEALDAFINKVNIRTCL